jgi:FkbM family methyltransferase
MIISLERINKEYNLNIKGIIHIGGHYGQEYDSYKLLNVPIIFFEPLSKNYSILESRVSNDKNVQTFQCALGNENKTILMNVETANQGQSSSILKPKKHLEQYPHITFDYTEEVHMFKLDDIDIGNNEYNFINIDVQGYELEVLKGSSKFLESVDYIMSEVNNDEVYENCAKVEELDQFLSQYNFSRVETNWAGGIWGDALYIKNYNKTI